MSALVHRLHNWSTTRDIVEKPPDDINDFYDWITNDRQGLLSALELSALTTFANAYIRLRQRTTGEFWTDITEGLSE